MTKAWLSCSLESTGTGLQLSFEDFPGGGGGWGWGKAGNTAKLSPASAGAWAELGKISHTSAYFEDTIKRGMVRIRMTFKLCRCMENMKQYIS